MVSDALRRVRDFPPEEKPDEARAILRAIEGGLTVALPAEVRAWLAKPSNPD
jgi:hypothetical protein